VKMPCLFGFVILLGGCALSRPDHFYVLDCEGQKTPDARTEFAAEVTLRVTVPPLVDRNEMVMMGGDGVRILEHERWAAPLSDQVAAVLGQDIEARREDVIMASRRIAKPALPNTTISVDVVRLELRQGSGVQLEARWRLENGQDGKLSQGRETFTAASADGSILGITHAIDTCLGLLADRLIAGLPR